MSKREKKRKLPSKNPFISSLITISQVYIASTKLLLLNKFWRVLAVWEKLVRWVLVSIIVYKVELEGYLLDILPGINNIKLLRSYTIYLLGFLRELVTQYKVYCLEVY